MQPPCLESLTDFQFAAHWFLSLAVLGAPGHLVHPSAYARPVFLPHPHMQLLCLCITRKSVLWFFPSGIHHFTEKELKAPK